MSHCSVGDSPPDELAAVLRRLTVAGAPWLAVVPAAAVMCAAPSGWPADVTVIDVTDMRSVPLTVNPFQPGPGAGVQAHADRLAGLVEATFRPPGPVRAALRLALRRVYADCGWDAATGTALPGAAGPPAIPCVADLRRAALAATAELGHDAATRAAVRGFLDVKLAALWLGPAGHFLGDGHPVDVTGLLRRKVVFTVGDIPDDEAAAFLAGVLLIRMTEQVRTRKRAGWPSTVVIAVPAGRLRRQLAELDCYGAHIVHARYVPVAKTGTEIKPEADPVVPRVALLGRRSTACGLQCRQRPCSGYELHAARVLAGSAGQAWFRLWGQAMVLAFLTGRPMPHLPAQVRRSWSELDVRTRECLLATVVQGAVTTRALALRRSYDPARLASAVAATGTGLLAAVAPAGAGPPATLDLTPIRAGQVWVIPQLRWLHEVERLRPLGQCPLRCDDIAPPLDFDLSGLPDWPGIRVGDRLDALRRHRLSMDAEPNRVIALTALLGAEPVLEADLATAGMGLARPQRLGYAARVLGATPQGTGQHNQQDQRPSWLEVVLSWPSRLIKPGLPQTMPRAATG